MQIIKFLPFLLEKDFRMLIMESKMFCIFTNNLKFDLWFNQIPYPRI